jgi:hypothetical protein
MKRFLVLYQSEVAAAGGSTAEMIANTSPEQMQAGMALWRAWHAKCQDAIVDLGAPLGGSVTVDAGGASARHSAITGYSILQALSKDDAVGLMEGHPHFHMPGASIQVLEVVPMPGL